MPQGDSYNNLTALTIADDDEFVVFDDPAGATDTKNITASELRAYAQVGVAAGAITDGEASATTVDAGTTTAAAVTVKCAGVTVDAVSATARTAVQTTATGRKVYRNLGDGIGLVNAELDGMFFAVTSPNDDLPPGSGGFPGGGDAGDRFAGVNLGEMSTGGEGVAQTAATGNLSKIATSVTEIDSSGNPRVAASTTGGASARGWTLTNEAGFVLDGPSHMTNVGATVTDTARSLTVLDDGCHIPLDTSSNSIAVSIENTLPAGFSCSFRKTSGSNSVTFATGGSSITPIFIGQATATAINTMLTVLVESSSVAIVTIAEQA